MGTAVRIDRDGFTAPNFGTESEPPRHYRIDPPRIFEGVECDHLMVCIYPPTKWSDGEVSVIPCNADASHVFGSTRRRPGSFVLHEDYRQDDAAYVEGCYAWALSAAGGYQIVEPEPEPESEPSEPHVHDPVTEGEFDPSQHIVSDVWAYLDAATPEERTRVIEAERNGKARKSILNYVAGE